jgi:hypothetical protein
VLRNFNGTPWARRDWDAQERESMLARVLEPLISYMERWARFGALEQHELAQVRLLHANFVELMQTIDDRERQDTVKDPRNMTNAGLAREIWAANPSSVFRWKKRCAESAEIRRQEASRSNWSSAGPSGLMRQAYHLNRRGTCDLASAEGSAPVELT